MAMQPYIECPICGEEHQAYMKVICSTCRAKIDKRADAVQAYIYLSALHTKKKVTFAEVKEAMAKAHISIKD